MRTVVLTALGFLSTVFAGSWAQILAIGGIQIDIVLLICISLALLDRTAMPVIFAACTGLYMDLCYSTLIGCTALAYTLTTASIFFLVQRADRINLLIVVAAGGASYLLKNGLIALILHLTIGMPDGVSGLFIRYIFPGAAIAAGLIIPAYWLLSRLMRRHFMHVRRKMADEY